MTNFNEIADYYDQNSEKEYKRLIKTPFHEAEFYLTIDLFEEYIKKDDNVLDIGSGPGRYSEYLVKKFNCNVGLLDLSQKSLDLFLKRIGKEIRKKVLFTCKKSATKLDNINDSSFDIVLLLGPLYHLKEKSERKRAIREARRVLKKKGYIFVSFLSPYPLFPRMLKIDNFLKNNDYFIEELNNKGLVKSYSISSFIEQYRCWPNQAQKMMEKERFQTVRIRNLEGVGTFFKEEQIEVLNDENKKEGWFNILKKTCENPDLLGATIHFLYVGQKI